MKTTFILLIWLLSIHCATAQDKNFQWLTGTWKIQNESVFEVWELKEGSQNLSGKSFRVEGADTVVTEVISLSYYKGSFHYIPDVAGDQPPIDFTITASDSQSFVAENPHHDFPKIIRYRYLRKEGREMIEASIEGNGKVISYSFEKLK
jgi:hypothetical protein